MYGYCGPKEFIL